MDIPCARRLCQFLDLAIGRLLSITSAWVVKHLVCLFNQLVRQHTRPHHQQGSRIAVLHQLGHAEPSRAEFGYLHREKRSGLEVSSLFTNEDHRELCEIARDSVDTWVLHNCSVVAETPGSRRRLSNLTEALYEATEREISVVGLRGQDAFDALTHRRGSDGKVLFTGRPVWFGAKRPHGTPRGPKVA